MLLLSQQLLKNGFLKQVLNHLFNISNYIEINNKLPIEIIDVNSSVLANASEDIIYNNAEFYRGVRIVTNNQANLLAVIGLLKSLYVNMDSKSSMNNFGDIQKNIYQLEQILKKMSISWIPFFQPVRTIISSLDLLENRLLNLEILKIKRHPLVINMTTLKNTLYFAHYLPNCNYINLYCIRNPELVKELFFHEIGHLIIFSITDNTRKLPDDYLKLSSVKTNYVGLAVEEFCDNFSLYINNKLIDPALIGFFDNFLKKIN